MFESSKNKYFTKTSMIFEECFEIDPSEKNIKF